MNLSTAYPPPLMNPSNPTVHSPNPPNPSLPQPPPPASDYSPLLLHISQQLHNRISYTISKLNILSSNVHTQVYLNNPSNHYTDLLLSHLLSKHFFSFLHTFSSSLSNCYSSTAQALISNISSSFNTKGSVTVDELTFKGEVQDEASRRIYSNISCFINDIPSR